MVTRKGPVAPVRHHGWVSEFSAPSGSSASGGSRPRRPTLLGKLALDSLAGAPDPAELVEAAHAAAWLLVSAGRDSEDPQVQARLVRLVDEVGLDTLADLWSQRPARSLPGALWRLYALREWVRSDPVGAAVPLTDLEALFRRVSHPGRRIAVVTTDDRAPTDATLRHLGVRDVVAALVCGDDGFPVKPAPDAIFALCQALRTSPDRVAVIGDSPADIAMGRSAGAGLVVGVRTGIGRDMDLAAADVIVDSVADLV